MGHGNVVHYKSVVRQLCRFPVEEVPLASFAHGRAIWVRSHREPRFDSIEVTHRARSRLGEDRYRIFSNNCEHFCEWCLHGEHRSYQVESLLQLPRRLARTSSDAIAGLLTRLTRSRPAALAYITTLKQPGVCAIVPTTHARSTAP